MATRESEISVLAVAALIPDAPARMAAAVSRKVAQDEIRPALPDVVSDITMSESVESPRFFGPLPSESVAMKYGTLPAVMFTVDIP